MDRLAALERLAAEAAHGDLHFPTCAQASLRIREALDDPDCHIDAAARLVQADPLLAARIVAVANSAALNASGRAVADVRTAIARLGHGTVRSLVIARLARQLAGMPVSPQVAALTATLWGHTAHVAALARVLARRLTRQDAEVAFFAGIVHEIGGFYLLSRAADDPSLLPPAAGEEIPAAADAAHAVAGALSLAVLRRLDVPTPVMEAVEAHWQGFLGMPPRTLADTLLLADFLAPVASPLDGSPIDGGRAALDCEIDARTLSETLAESANEVEGLAAALRG